MGTLSSLLSVSLSALQADQVALNVTANNVANQNTVGYTRETVDFQSQDSVSINGVLEDGVTTGAGPVSQRDRILEQSVQQQTQQQAQSSTLQSALEQVQNIFGLTSTSTSASSTALGSATDGFFNSLSSLTANPSDTATRQTVLSTANTLAQTFNSASSQLQQISSGLDKQVTSIVGQINSLTTTIASLNQQIASVSPNADAGTLEDQRQAAIAQLSQYIGLDQISTQQNGITLTTTSGEPLVVGNQAVPLTTTSIGGTTHILAGPNHDDITASTTGGQLGGVLQARDQQIPTFAAALDNLAYGIATQVNTQNQQGTDANGNPGQAIFAIGSSASGAAAAISVSTSDPNAVAAAAVGEGSAGNDNAQALANLSTANIVGGQTAAGYVASLLDQIGTATAAATNDSASQQASLTQLTTQRDSLSGVSLDQEASNLTQYQRAYEAASKVFTIADSIMASALNLGEQTTVA
jgi:flagellar hook-associated protein 1 FlgK